jgi:ectoine hydroxylase-related dioxygenase (phytanoyl-CoA dioxygenase family)
MSASWLSEEHADLEDFMSVVSTPTELSDYPHAARVEHGIVVFDSATLPGADRLAERRAVMAEIAHALMEGPGVVAFEGAFADHGIIDRVSAAFNEVIAEQHAAGTAAGDHFAKPGANDRIWNALEKLALRDPRAFAEYYANDIIALASRSWLGPGYQVTSQVNVVNPGGQAQVPHCDYHLGFMGREQNEEYPAHVHRLSPALTLQGAVAHTDMPIETGPTFYLPHSQKFPSVYLAWRRPDIAAYIAEHTVQLALAKGDAVFFNPALIHGAGTNVTSDVRRMANLLQVSSAFGRAMETIDRAAMTRALYPVLAEATSTGSMPHDSIDNVIAASAEGYAFPTNLDRDQPIGGLAPPSQADIVRRALREGWDEQVLTDELGNHSQRRATS